MARVPYPSAEALPENVRDLVVSARQGRPMPVFRAVGNDPAVLAGLRAFLGALWTDSGLTERQRELVTLAVARAVGSRYEWHQPVTTAGGERRSVEEPDALGAGELDRFEPHEVALVAYARAVADGTVDDVRHAAVREALGDDAAVVGAAATAAGYLGLARVIDALGVELEAGETFVGWRPPAGDG